MAHITIVTPSLERRSYWRYLQAVWYDAQPQVVHRIVRIDDTRAAYDCMRDALEDDDSDYIVYAGDDDFHLPFQLYVMAAYLDDHPEYVGAYGQGILAHVSNDRVGWTCSYDRGMAIERVYSLTRGRAFKAALDAVLEMPPSSDRTVLEAQNRWFIREVEAFGPFKAVPGLQLIHTHHADRGAREHPEPRWRRFVEAHGGGWLASWLPSRASSRRNLERRR